MAPVTFVLDNTNYVVDVDAKEVGLWRQNAMTTYEFVRPYMIAAREFSSDMSAPKPIQFYHVACKDFGWVRIPTELGDKIIRQCDPWRFELKNKTWLFAIISSIVVGGVIHKIAKFRK